MHAWLPAPCMHGMRNIGLTISFSCAAGCDLRRYGTGEVHVSFNVELVPTSQVFLTYSLQHSRSSVVKDEHGQSDVATDL